MERRLSAILAADVVGYSALMERDEAGTFERLKAHRKELLEPEVEKHHGRIFKLMGDGLLAEFASVVDAVECAASVQRGMAERNSSAPEDKRIEVRIGINLGEVIVEGDDRYGEGVNIAARLQQLAEPGGICVSGKVSKEVEKKLAFAFEPMGEQRVKNIAEPIPVYRVKLDGATARTRRASGKPSSARWIVAAAALLALLAGVTGAWYGFLRPTEPPAFVAREPSLAVLPFDNLSNDKEQGYLADGIAEDLTTELARVPDLFVVSRNAAFGYKGKGIRPAQIATELGVRYLLEGSLRRLGEDLRINAQLIDAKTGGHVWAERFDGAWGQVFEIQDKMIEKIATALKLRLISGQRAAQIAGGTSNPAAYEVYLSGLELERSDEPEDWAKAVRHFEQALALDPNFGAAAARLAWVYEDARWWESRRKALRVSREVATTKASVYLEEAAKHPSPAYYQLLADKLVWQLQSDEAIAVAERAIALDPSDADGYEQMSLALTFNGRAADGRGYLDAAMRVDPGWTRWRRFLAGLAYFSMDRFEDAATSLELIDVGSKRNFSADYYGLPLLTSAYGHLGHRVDVDSAEQKLRPYLVETEGGDFTGLFAANTFPFKNYADLERVLQGLRKAGVPELPYGFDPKSKDRLTGAEIKSLFFGHERQGRELTIRSNSPKAYSATTAADGAARVTIGTWSQTGITRIQGDTACNVYSTHVSCHAVFRNPEGAFATKNEYLLVHQWGRLEFSVIK